MTSGETRSLKPFEKTSEIQAILFDLDGTLIDSEQTAIEATRRCFSEWGMALNDEDAHFITGRTWESAFQHLFEKYTLPLSPSEAKTHILRQYRDAIQTSPSVVPGGADAVRALAGHFRMGLVSGSHRSDILWALSHLKIQHHFELVLGAEDYHASKPHPEGYLAALQTLQIQAHRCLVFEDSLAGITAARAAGTWVTAITSTNHARQDQSQAHFHIHNFKGVNAQWIHSLFNPSPGAHRL